MSSKKPKIYKIKRKSVTKYRYYYTDEAGEKRQKESINEAKVKSFALEHEAAQANLGKLSEYEVKDVARWASLELQANEKGTTLADCVAGWLPIHEKNDNLISKDIWELVREYLEEKKQEWQPAQYKDASLRLERWALNEYLIDRNEWKKDPSVLKDKKEILIQNNKAWDYIYSVSDTTGAVNTDNLRRQLNAFFNWCCALKRGRDGKAYHYLLGNPLAGMSSFADKGASKKKREICILSVENAKIVLRACLENYDHTVCPYIIIALFSGVRPNEFRKSVNIEGVRQTVALLWDDVLSSGSDEINISAELSKVEYGRSVPHEAVMSSWLDWLGEKRKEALKEAKAIGNSGERKRTLNSLKFVKYVRHNFYYSDWLNENPHVKKILGGKVDILRHSYGTYQMKLKDNTSELVAKWMGNSGRIVNSKYYNTKVTLAEAKKFWALTPQSIINEFNLET